MTVKSVKNGKKRVTGFFFFKQTFEPRKKVLKTLLLPRLQKKKPVDFDDELRIGDVRYDNMIKITFKVQLF